MSGNMTILNTTQVLVFMTTSLIVIGLYLQAVKLWKTRSVDDFHPVMVVAILVNESVWLIYGLQLREWPIIVIPILSIPAAIAISVGYFRFRRNNGNGNRENS